MQPATEQDIQEANGGEVTASSSEAISSYSSTFFWSQGQAPVDMGPLTTQLCFLTRITGNFRGTGESVKVVHNTSTNRWELFGTSQQAGVAASARCIPYDFSKWDWEKSWNSSQGDVDLGTRKACLMTRISGTFNGAGESIRTYRDGSNHWHIAGQAQSGSGVFGGFICLDADPARPMNVSVGDPSFDQAANGEHAIVFGFGNGANEPLTGPVCFLSRMTGNFRGGGERIAVYTTRSSIFNRWDWMINAAANQAGVATSAVCFN